MKKIIFTVLSIGMMSTVTFGQQRGNKEFNPEVSAKRTVERLTKSLALSKSQQDSIYHYSVEQAKKHQKLFADRKNDRRKLSEEAKDIRTQNENKIKSFLDADQVIKYENLQKEGSNRGGQARRKNSN